MKGMLAEYCEIKMADRGVKTFDLVKKLEKDGWSDYKEISLSYARGGVKRVISDWWEDDCAYMQELCADIIDWHRNLEDDDAK